MILDYIFFIIPTCAAGFGLSFLFGFFIANLKRYIHYLFISLFIIIQIAILADFIDGYDDLHNSLIIDYQQSVLQPENRTYIEVSNSCPIDGNIEKIIVDIPLASILLAHVPYSLFCIFGFLIGIKC